MPRFFECAHTRRRNYIGFRHMKVVIIIIITIIITRRAYRLDWCYAVFMPHVFTAITVFSKQFCWCANCASRNGAGPMPTRIWLMHLAKPRHEPEDANGKKTAQTMQPSWHFAKTDTKSDTHFRAVFFDSPDIHHVENHHFTTVKTQFLWFSIFWFFKKCTTTSAVFNPAGYLCIDTVYM